MQSTHEGMLVLPAAVTDANSEIHNGFILLNDLIPKKSQLLFYTRKSAGPKLIITMSFTCRLTILKTNTKQGLMFFAT